MELPQNNKIYTYADYKEFDGKVKFVNFKLRKRKVI